MPSELTVANIPSADRVVLPVYDSIPSFSAEFGALSIIVDGDGNRVLHVYNGSQWVPISESGGYKKNGLILYLDSSKSSSYSGQGNTWFDLSGLGNDGTLNGGVSYSQVNSGVLSFDGNNDYVGLGKSLTGPSELSTGDVPYSLEAWFKITSDVTIGNGLTTNAASIVGNASSTGVGFQVYKPNSLRVNFGARSTSNFDSNGSLSLNQWYHVVCTRRVGDGNYIYINGVLDTGPYSAGSLTILSTTGEMQIGWANTRIPAYFPGQIGLVRIYNQGMSTAEVQKNFNSSKARFGVQ